MVSLAHKLHSGNPMKTNPSANQSASSSCDLGQSAGAVMAVLQPDRNSRLHKQQSCCLNFLMTVAKGRREEERLLGLLDFPNITTVAVKKLLPGTE